MVSHSEFTQQFTLHTMITCSFIFLQRNKTIIISPEQHCGLELVFCISTLSLVLGTDISCVYRLYQSKQHNIQSFAHTGNCNKMHVLYAYCRLFDRTQPFISVCNKQYNTSATNINNTRCSLYKYIVCAWYDINYSLLFLKIKHTWHWFLLLKHRYVYW